MNRQYDKDIALNSILYILEKLGGQADMHKIYKTLYFADREHLSRYGRRIINDVYIAMQFGPVPSMTHDIMKALRGDSYFSDKTEELKGYFHFINKYVVRADRRSDPDYMSESDTECLDYAINMCKNLSFSELTNLSHGLAWKNSAQDRAISYADIMRENDETEEYAEYIKEKIKLSNAFC